MKNRMKLKLELLRMEGQGLNKSEIVDALAQQFHVSRKLGYYYYKTRSQWQPEILGLEDAKAAYHQTLNRLEFIYRHFSLLAQTAPENSNRVGALKGMLATIIKKAELTGVLAPSGTSSLDVDDVFDDATFRALAPQERDLIMQATQIFLRRKEEVERSRVGLFKVGEKHDA